MIRGPVTAEQCRSSWMFAPGSLAWSVALSSIKIRSDVTVSLNLVIEAVAIADSKSKLSTQR